ncbi:MAG: sugar phosphate nucleotidyltransferase [Stellaceae bacterium]
MRTATVRQAAILTGGLGTRLGELTASTPKPLLPCGNRPFLGWLVRELSRFGLEEVILLTGHLAEAVEAMLPSIEASLPKPLRIICSREQQPAGTGGALIHAREHLAERFLVCNGDSWFDFNVARLLADALQDPEEIIGRIALRRLDDVTRYGVVEMDGDRVTNFHERDQRSQPGIINAGVYLFDYRVLDTVAPNCSLERDVMPALASRGALRGTVADGYFIDIGVPADLTRAQTELPARLLRRALFLNGDVVFKFDRGSIGTRESVDFTPGALSAIRATSEAGWHVFVVAKQSEIARDCNNELEFGSLCTRMTEAVRTAAGTIDDLRYCPPHPEGRAGTLPGEEVSREATAEALLDLVRRWEVNPARCLLIGDRSSDLTAAAAAGIPAHLFPGGNLAEFAVPLLADCQRHPNP